MYTDGTLDLMLMIAVAAFKPPAEKEESLALVVKRAKTRYFPVFEKVGGRDPVCGRARTQPNGDKRLGALARDRIPVGAGCARRSCGCGGVARVRAGNRGRG